MLRENPDLRERLIAAFEANRDTRQPSPHVEEQIYDGFFSAGDEGLMASFHSASWEDRPGIVDQFDDARLRELGYRLIYCERADVLNEAAFRAESTRIARKLLGLERGVLPWLTLREAIQEANDRIEMAGSDRSHLIEHRNFLQTRLAEAMRVIG
jgi:exodeoxyribonuclease-1